jgi:uronate dehydrogenase
VVDALEGADAVVHLAGLPDEAPLPDLLDGNVLGSYHVLEAARRQGVGRVVLASSNRVTGFYPVGQVVAPDAPVRPDGFYGVSKVAVEALGRLYADKFGLSVVCLRIGSFEDEPTEARFAGGGGTRRAGVDLATWLSPHDGVGFIRAAITAPDVHFVTAYAVSANTRRFWDTAAGAQLGYLPMDNAEGYAAQVPGSETATDVAALQGGAYTGAEYSLRHVVPLPPAS